MKKLALIAMVCVGAVFCGAATVTAGWVGEDRIFQIVVAACTLACLVGGLSARKAGGTPLFCVALAAVFLLVLYLCGMAIFGGEQTWGANATWIAAGALGGMVISILLGGRKKIRAHRGR